MNGTIKSGKTGRSGMDSQRSIPAKLSKSLPLCSDFLITTPAQPFTNPPFFGTINQIMKSNLHPTDYRPVVFSDDVAGFAFLTQSTAQTTDTIKWEDGNEYPLVKVHISSASHPFFTGEEKIIDTEGRVDRFKNRAAAAEKRKQALANKAKKQNANKAKKAEQ